MPSDDIKAIYKKLVQVYAKEHPSNSLWLLNQHLDAYTKHTWTHKESAVLDLALRKDIEIQAVKQLMDSGLSKQDAILQVSQDMTLSVKETETKGWTEEIVKEEKEASEKRRKILHLSEEDEKDIKNYEKTVKKLTILFHNGDMTEETYRAAIRSLEEENPKRRVSKIRGAGRKRAISSSYVPEVQRTPNYVARRYMEKPSGLWYLVPFLFGIIGGIIGYVAVRDQDRDMANGLLVFGIFISFITTILLFISYSWMFSTIGSFY